MKQGKAQAQKRFKMLSLNLRPLLGMDTNYNNQKQSKTKLKTNKPTANPDKGRESNYQSYHIMIQMFSYQPKKYRK